MGTTTTETALALRPTTDLADEQVAPGTPEFEQTATHMAREFSEATGEIARLIGEIHLQTQRLDTAFQSDSMYSRYGIDMRFNGHIHNVDPEGAEEIVKEMARRSWGILIDKLGIKNVMSVAKRKAFDEQIERGDLPPICEQTITAILLGLTGQVEDFAREAAREVFDMLRPNSRYKTNDKFRVGRKVILAYRVESGWGRDPWHVTYTYEQGLTAVDGIFHLLAGRGIMRENKGPLVCAINAADAGGRGETEFFKFRCFKNRNLHLEFRRLDLVKELNFLAAGERVLGADVE